MEVPTICAICGKEAKPAFTCVLCGTICCKDCIKDGVCKRCQAKS